MGAMTVKRRPRGRVCLTCKQWKAAKDFWPHQEGVNGLHPRCCKCMKIKQKEAGQKPRARAMQAWYNMLARCGKKGAYLHVRIEFDKMEFLAWAVPAMAAWLTANPGGVPSVDRKDADGHYAAGNVQIVSRGDNSRTRRNAFNTRPPSGQAWCSCCRRYLPRASFHKAKNRTNGLRGYCRGCRAAKYAETGERT